MERFTHPFGPVYNENSRVLLLGTFPSPKSREAGYPYAHPQNRMWKVLGALCREEVTLTREGVHAFLRSHRIALWDVLKSCEIEGASDARIKNPVPNDFSEIFQDAQIRAVFCTGRKAYDLYMKLCQQREGIPVFCLPSTSPANAAFSLEKLTAAYRMMDDYIK